jgi:hypothetical protein
MNVRIRHSMTFTAGIYYAGETCMNNYVLTLSMITHSTEAASHNVAFERLKYFVYNCLDSTIFINQEHEDQCARLANAGLSVTTLPGDPVDQLIGLMLYYKLNAIMEDRIIVEETEISSSLGENMVYLHSENEITDIGIVPDWWATADTAHNDLVLIGTDKIVSMHGNTVWRELDLTWPESATVAETGNVVVFRDFKPGNETK